MEVLQHVLDSLPLGVASYNGNTVSVRINQPQRTHFMKQNANFQEGILQP